MKDQIRGGGRTKIEKPQERRGLKIGEDVVMWKVKHVISVLMREEERAAKGEKGYLMMYEEVLLLSVTEERKNSLLELYR